jgi:hypothetical protein
LAVKYIEGKSVEIGGSVERSDRMAFRERGGNERGDKLGKLIR